MKELWGYQSRLAIRLGSDDPISVAFGDAATSLGKALPVLSEVTTGEPYDAERQRRITDVTKRAIEQQIPFHDLAARRVGLKRKS